MEFNRWCVAVHHISSSSITTMTVGDNSTFNLGTGTLTNNGKIQLKAVPGLAAGIYYSPITATHWSGTGIVQALGGTWNSTTHTFTVSPAGDNGFWSGAVGAAWSNLANWPAGISAPPGTGKTATFNAANGNTIVDLGTGVMLKNIVFDTSSAAAYTIGAGAAGSQALCLENGGGVAMNAAVTKHQVINAGVLLDDAAAASHTITNNGPTNTLTCAGAIQGGFGGMPGVKTLNFNGNGAIVVSGAISNGAAQAVGLAVATVSDTGMTTLAGANTYGDGTAVYGLLTFANASARPVGDVLSLGRITDGAVVLLKTGETIEAVRAELLAGTIKAVAGTPATQGVGYMTGRWLMRCIPPISWGWASPALAISS